MARIVADNIVVDFPIYGGKSRSLKSTFMRTATGGLLARDAADRIVIRALDRCTFDFQPGDRVGLVGHNGSGKTTLLRVLAGVYQPTYGSISVAGKVTSMLSITLGMDDEATGMENIYLRGVIMGLRPRDIDLLVDDICEFSELGDYLHVPVRTYSSGMLMRLAFAVSTSVSADVILMDEWLSVGDASFAKKAQQRLAKLIEQAKILVIASHDENLIRTNCNRVLRLEHGHLIANEGIG
jgi:lipopolysaccharide transport system ATP-binding protein